MIRLSGWLAMILCVASGPAIADAERRLRLIQMGLEAYAEAQSRAQHDARIAAFSRAERMFSEAARYPGAGADLYANAGTAALQAERLGPAVLAFRRALAADPDHRRSRRNLAHARTLLPAWVPRPADDSVLDTFFFWHRALSTAERGALGALCFLLAALGFAAAVYWRSRLARSLAWLPAAAWLALLISIVVEVHGERGSQAVITADETVTRAADSSNAPARFPDPLPGGSEVEVIETRDRWARIRLANNLEGWVSRQSLERVYRSSEDVSRETASRGMQ